MKISRKKLYLAIFFILAFAILNITVISSLKEKITELEYEKVNISDDIKIAESSNKRRFSEKEAKEQVYKKDDIIKLNSIIGNEKGLVYIENKSGVSGEASSKTVEIKLNGKSDEIISLISKIENSGMKESIYSINISKVNSYQNSNEKNDSDKENKPDKKDTLDTVKIESDKQKNNKKNSESENKGNIYECRINLEINRK